MLVRRTWHGDEILARGKRATGRAIVGMAEEVAVQMKHNTHVQFGDLRRSVHAAKVDTMGAVNVTEPGLDDTTPVSPGAQELSKTGKVRFGVEVGSWMPYACVENNRGGAHAFAQIGWDLGVPTFDPKLIRAWREEGL